MALWLAIMIPLGGVSGPWPKIQWVITISSLVILVAALVRLRNGFPTRLSAWGAALALASLALVFAYLVPLPPAIWQGLPGRSLFTNVAEFLSISGQSRPLSLDPAATWQMALALIPALAAYFAALTVSFQHMHRVVLAILLCAFAGLTIGLMQRFYGESSGLYFYTNSGGSTLGTFINRNLFAAQLFTAIPWLAAFAMYLNYKSIVHPAVIIVFNLIFGAVLLAGLAATGSRAGTLLAMLAVLASILFVFRRISARSQPPKVGSALIVTLVALLVMAQASMVGILRLGQQDHLADYRSTIFDVGLTAAKTHFPLGSGFGTFVPIYEMHETPQTIIPNYVNHAHNDWLELVIEGGAPALVLMLAFLTLLFVAMVQIIRRGTHDVGTGYLRAALVVVILFLLHSIPDFPLRAIAHLVVFAFCCGIITLARAEGQSWTPRKQNTTAKPSAKPELRPFSRPTRGFGAAKAESTA